MSHIIILIGYYKSQNVTKYYKHNHRLYRPATKCTLDRHNIATILLYNYTLI